MRSGLPEWTSYESRSETLGKTPRTDCKRRRETFPWEVGTQLIARQLSNQKVHRGVQNLLAVPEHDRDMTLVGLLHEPGVSNLAG